MNNRKDLESKVEKAMLAQKRVTDTLADLAGKEAILQDEVNHDLLAGNEEGQSFTKLVEIQGKISAWQKTIPLAASELALAQRELRDFDLAEQSGRAQALDKQMSEMASKIQEAIGEAGVQGQLDRLADLLAQVRQFPESVRDQDQQIRERFYDSMYHELSRSLLEVWQKIENVPHVKTPPRQTVNIEPGYIPGFGRRA